MTLTDSDDDEDNLCSFVVELLQKDRRKLKLRGMKNVDMGFVIYKVCTFKKKNSSDSRIWNDIR